MSNNKNIDKPRNMMDDELSEVNWAVVAPIIAVMAIVILLFFIL